MNKVGIVLISLCLTANCLADENLYICNTLSVSELNDSGSLEESNFAKALAMHQAKFAVDRNSGIVAGGPFATVDASDGRILSPGTDQEALKIVWLSQSPYNHLKYLWVRAYAEGPKKPFLGVSGNVVITGVCE